MHVGDRLRELREAAGLNLPEAAAIAGTSKQSASQIEKGVTKVPGGLFLYRWSQHYGVNLEWLITGKGTAKQSQSHPERLSEETIAAGWELAQLVSAQTTGSRVLEMPRDAALVAQAINTILDRDVQRPAPSARVDIGGTDDGIGTGKAGADRGASGEADAGAKSAPARGRRRQSAA